MAAQFLAKKSGIHIQKQIYLPRVFTLLILSRPLNIYPKGDMLEGGSVYVTLSSSYILDLKLLNVFYIYNKNK